MCCSTLARKTTIQHDSRWQALVERDPKVDGKFVYAVKTTGVYCRPSCSSRLANPENIAFYDTPAAAEQAGFRPCKRCRPDLPSAHDSSVQQAERIAQLCRYIETADHIPSLEELARHASLSAYHLHRLFKTVTGLTPRAYAAAYRAKRIRNQLVHRDSVTEAMYEAGYNSSGRFYEETDHVLGMTPSDYKAGGAAVDIRFAVGECTLGAILVAQSERGVCAILLGDDPDRLVRNLQDQFPAANLLGGEADFEKRVAEVVGFVEAPQLGFNLPLDIRGTAFQRRIWEVLRKIPAGETLSYTEVARLAGMPKAARAVAQACAANTLAVAIPCHRVIRSDGGLSGYRWGVERKRTLLEREGAV